MPREQSPMKGTGKQIFQVPGMNELRTCREQGRPSERCYRVSERDEGA